MNKKEWQLLEGTTHEPDRYYRVFDETVVVIIIDPPLQNLASALHKDKHLMFAIRVFRILDSSHQLQITGV